MAEEQRCQEGHRLCANNCGFFGSPATLDLCSKCYRDHRLKEEQQQTATAAVEKSLPAFSSAGAGAAEPTADVTEPSIPYSPATATAVEVKEEEKASKKAAAASAGPSRCAMCRKRVGLTGFRCRCGSTYCGGHRYAEQHGCTFDFKAAGREAIARANPVVKADKLRKI
ncbi:zinc finger A20 and AN1 domain-containing stress-associated protein 5 [Canna indica]|uniref:Zinc finger A20 and AN1 domain-containing stress-associated protein 5 n=1 Tax=Canna indica TaxID=4628 RepID=A0AAQ3KTJ9_9LILI|nr:zinc finger A20 and AN1 domain-containing stress-associated protein 5 [Canna indica]